MRVTLLHNPTAGDEEHGRDHLLSVLAEAGHEVQYQSVKEDGWETAVREPAELVVVAGGDGTVGKVFKALAGSGRAVTLLPVGTANNIARTLGLPEAADPSELVRGLEDASRRPFDIGQVESDAGEALFVETAGGGIFAEVLVRAERGGEDADGPEKIELGLRLLAEVVEDAEALEWQLDLDGRDLSGELLAVEAMNVRETGPNIPLAPGADPGDGLLDVVMVRPEHRGALAAYIDARRRGRNGDAPRFQVERGRRLALRAAEGVWLHADEQPWDARAAVAKVDRVQLGVLVP